MRLTENVHYIRVNATFRPPDASSSPTQIWGLTGLKREDRQVPPERDEARPFAPRCRALALLLITVVPLALPVPTRAADFPTESITGRVFDLLGRGIPGVDVLVFPGGRDSPGPTLTTFRTDVRGRFHLSDLNPGRYFIALNKPGYQILLAQVNTRILSRLSLTLLPASTGGEPLPAAGANSMDWILRAPRSDVLKEWRERDLPPTEKGVSDTTRGEDGTPSSSRGGGKPSLARVPVNGEVQQWFTSGLPFDAGSSQSTESNGRATALNVRGDIGGRGDWRVGGVAGTLSTGPAEPDAEGVVRDQGSDRLRLAMRYQLGPADSVRVQARYDRDRLREEGFTRLLSPGNQEVRTLGYQANWARRAERGDDLEMNLGFLQALGRIPDPGAGPGISLVPSEEESLQDRRWTAGAAYGFSIKPEHRVSVKAQTRLYRYDFRDEGLILAPVQSALSYAEAGERGWSVSLSGEDTWKLSTPMSLTLGVDYHWADGLRASSLLVPHVGARLERERTLFEGRLLARIDRFADFYAGDRASFRMEESGENLTGYRLEMLRKLGATWTLAGHAQQNPLEFEQEHSAWDTPVRPADPGAFFLMDPAAMTNELGLQIGKRFNGIEGTLASDRGRASGRVASGLDQAPIQILGEAEIRYVAVKASARVDRTDTQVQLDYRRMLQETESAAPGEVPDRASRVDFQVFQQVPFLGRRGPMDWRFLFAYQTLSRDPGTAGATISLSLPDRVRRLSGGIGVSF